MDGILYMKDEEEHYKTEFSYNRTTDMADQIYPYDDEENHLIMMDSGQGIITFSLKFPAYVHTRYKQIMISRFTRPNYLSNLKSHLLPFLRILCMHDANVC